MTIAPDCPSDAPDGALPSSADRPDGGGNAAGHPGPAAVAGAGDHGPETGVVGAGGAERSPFVAALGFAVRRWLDWPRDLAVTLIGVSVATLSDVLTPLVAGRLISDVTQGAPSVSSVIGDGAAHHALADAKWMLAAMAGLGLVSLLGRRASFLGITWLTVNMMRDVAQTSFARLQRFSTDWHANTFAGSTVRKLTRGMWAIDALNDNLLLMLVPEMLVLTGTTLVLGWHWPVMGLLLGGMSVVFVALSCVLTLRYVAPGARKANRWDSRVGAALADAITCNPVVKAFGAEEREEARLGRTLAIWRKRTGRSWTRGTNSGNVQNLAVTVMRVVLASCVVWLWWNGRAGPGDVAYVLTMIFLVQGYLRDIGQQVSVVQRSVNEMEELVAIWNQPPAVADVPGARPLVITRGEIRFEHVLFHYKGQTGPLFRDLDVEIPAGSRVGLVGPSGSGKSTFTKLLQRLYDINGGRILIDGVDIATVQQSSLRAQIAIVQQEPILFHRSLAENIAYARPGASQAEIERAAELANASGFIDRLPQGYDTLVGERGVKLSGGERQRVAIARAFLADARILILDEATASLDSESEALVQEAMERLMRDRTVIVIAHRLATVVGLDRILVFERGVVREDGPHVELIRLEGGLYRRLYELQSL
ncbi:ABC transporter ATP-binding protein [Acetobacter fallax]|uniref:ATP-binding cassette domain-containing protein n=1 Tax=Acetobacter fallax TaxID=1737473 RepID=A0ABX0K8F9_9PROT|nr:ABC transporter ATP-binding protein [Acetobacter fallax]NHO31491.1 ATP-binding cassette domain-containing protein [Acetobacter fallax]NHO34925.1 ATP-binding cassette domain-containing protein [Acetobacter fallax]